MTEIEWLLDRIVPLLILSMLHWVLALMLLDDLKKREKVFGGRKLPWAVLIPALAIFGSLLYLLCHPGIFIDIKRKQ